MVLGGQEIPEEIRHPLFPVPFTESEPFSPDGGVSMGFVERGSLLRRCFSRLLVPPLGRLSFAYRKDFIPSVNVGLCSQAVLYRGNCCLVVIARGMGVRMFQLHY